MRARWAIAAAYADKAMTSNRYTVPGISGGGTPYNPMAAIFAALSADSDQDGTPDAEDPAPHDPNDGGTITVVGSTEGIDFCGSDFFNAPDVLFGVRLSEDCYNHDANYGPDSHMDRIEADVRLFFDIYSRLTSHGVNVVAASAAALTYYEAVRGGGVFAYEGSGSPL